MKLFREPVPLHLRNAPADLVKKLGDGYQYPHDEENAFVQQSFLPDDLADRRYDEPSEAGDERDVARRLDAWRKRRQEGQ